MPRYNQNNAEEWYKELVARYDTMLTDELITLEAGFAATLRIMSLNGTPMDKQEATQVRLNAITSVINSRLK